MVNDMEIGWLAGIIDGEGSISIVRRHDLKRNGESLAATVMITNTDRKLLEKARRIMQELGVPKTQFHAHDNRYLKVRPATGFQQTRPCFRIYVGTCLGMRILLNAILPQLTSKAEQAKLMLEYCEGRGREARKRVTARDFDLADSISRLNHGRSGALETTREPRACA